MPNTYVALRTETVAVATPSVTFSLSGISGYTDLVVTTSFLPSVSTNQPYIQFNADTGTGSTNYSTTSLRGDGSSAASGRHTNNYGWFPVPGPGIGTNGNPEPWLISIMNYSNTTTFKTGLSRFNNASSILSANAHLWRNTAAISTVTIAMETGNFAVGSTFSLYGITSGIVPTVAKASGGTIYYGMDGYIYHKFTAGGSFVPSSAISADALIVAGGGGGGAGAVGGGGGAGGLRAFASQSLTSGTTYTVTVGGGGTAGVWEFIKGGTGGPSSIAGTGLTTIQSAGGGGGGSGDQIAAGPGNSGGSGGGGNYQGGSAGGAGNTPSTTPSQGNNGSAGHIGTNFGGGGGGAGSAASAYFGGAGADTYSDWGVITSSGENVLGKFWYAGGGGGGVRNSAGITSIGGYGGGGAGSKTSTGTAGTTNTGGGGGGTGWEANNTAGGSAGGSGIVIIRYQA